MAKSKNCWKETLTRRKEIDIRSVSREELVDITKLPKEKINCEEKEKQIKAFLEKVGNPYCFAVGDMIVKSSFSEGASLNQRIQELAAGL